MSLTASTQKGIILPWFDVENRDGIRYGFQKMLKVLDYGGFKILSIFEPDGQLVNRDLGPSAFDIRFETVLPDGWSLVAGYNGYGLPDSHIQHLLDAKGRLRGYVNLYYNSGDRKYHLQDAKLYCRYAVLDLPSFARLPIKLLPNQITDVVVDRVAVDPKRPADFPIVAYHHSRPAVNTLSEETPATLTKSAEEYLERIRTGQPRLNPPVYAWLHEHYPDWPDPFAYW